MDKMEKLAALYKEKGNILDTICVLNKALSEAKTKLAKLNTEIDTLEG